MAHSAAIELSIVIPTRGRPRQLQACLDSLASQTEPPGNFEVIVVLDGPDGATERILGSPLTLPYTLRVAGQAQAGAGSARNRGAKVARGRFLLFLDDDVVAEPTLVSAHLSVQRANEGVVGIGRIEKTLSGRRWARSRGQVRRRHYDQLATGRKPRFVDCYGANLSVPRDLFAAVGGFAVDIPVVHDVELGYRLEVAGARFVFVHGATVREDDREGLRHFLADSHRRGAVSVMLCERHPPLLPHLWLGGAGELSKPWPALRRVFMALRVPPLLAASAGILVRGERLTSQWYGFLDRYCYWRGVRSVVDPDTWLRLQRGAAILMYHAVGGDHERPGRYVVPERRFRRQMEWLRFRKYNVIGLDELVSCLREHRLLPPKAVAITFDDGYADNVRLALPVLRRLGFPATVFLVSSAPAKPVWKCVPELEERPLLSLAEARELLGSLSFGAHSQTHPELRTLSSIQVAREIAGSRADLESALGERVTTFAYPYGDTGPEIERAVDDAGFAAACGTAPGLNQHAGNIYALRRLEVRGTDSVLRFAATLWFAGRHSPLGRRAR